MSLLLSLLQQLAQFLKDNWIAIASWAVDYEESRVHAAQTQQEKAEVELAVEKSNEAVDAANRGKSDSDIIDDAIRGGPKVPDGK